MKLLQIVHKYEPYIQYFEEKYNIADKNLSFNELQTLLLNDGFYGPHILNPIANSEEGFFYVMWNYERLQFLWAKENNIDTEDLKEILQYQLNKYKPEVVYNMSPQLIKHNLLSNLEYNPLLAAWNADPYSIFDEDLNKYNALLTSSVNKVNESANGYLHYPSNDKFMKNPLTKEKNVDVFFYGQFDGEPFAKRRKYIKKLIPFLEENNISYEFALMYTPKDKLKYNIPFIRRFDWAKKHIPAKELREKFSEPLFGKDIYDKINSAKIIFNISAENDNFGDHKFNMRIFETLGVGSFMLSDKGVYPDYIKEGEDFETYADLDELKQKILYFIENDSEREKIAFNGKNKIEKHYSKEKQWQNFSNIVENLKKS